MGWAEKLRAVWRAYLELLRSELSALRGDLEATGRRVGGLLSLLVVAVVTLFWAVGLAVYAMVELVALWLPRWGATLAVLALLLLVIAVLGLVVRARWRRTELPTDTVRRRFDDHVDWWESNVVGGSGPGSGALGSGDSETDDRELSS